MVKERNPIVCILLSIITCGIYGIYWFIVITDDMNTVTPGDSFQTSGGTAFLLTLVTCGIYGLYWNYKMGAKVDQLKGGSNAVLFLILSLFGLGIVNYFIMQSELNARANA